MNKKLTVLKYSDLEVLNKAMNLAMFANMGDVDQINREEAAYVATSPESIHAVARNIFRSNNSSTLVYKSTAQ
jgi:hypothetical protein